MILKFTKSHGLGNDFIILNALDEPIELSRPQIKQIADRHLGIGFDQLLILSHSTMAAADFKYRIFNADGGEVEQCGNGVRCIARFIGENKLCDKEILCLESQAGLITVELRSDDTIKVDMGKPNLAPASIPFKRDVQEKNYCLNLFEQELTIMAVSMGNPHAIIIVDDVAKADVATVGARVEKHRDFPEKVNVEFVEVVTRETIKLRVYERGVGETLACGSGACAAVVAGIINGILDSCVTVELLGGYLTISWQGDESSVFMSGPAVSVFEGIIEL
jgi:diaminopimelate epimerase